MQQLCLCPAFMISDCSTDAAALYHAAGCCRIHHCLLQDRVGFIVWLAMKDPSLFLSDSAASVVSDFAVSQSDVYMVV